MKQKHTIIRYSIFAVTSRLTCYIIHVNKKCIHNYFQFSNSGHQLMTKGQTTQHLLRPIREMFNNTTVHGDDVLWTRNSGIGQAAVIDELIAEFSSSQMKLTETRSILLISMYVPLFLTAAIANSVVIVVVIKYHYMRR